MNPHIGQTIHYTAGNPTQCYAAITTAHHGDTEILIHVFNPNGPGFPVLTKHDPAQPITVLAADGHTTVYQDGSFTPGTWHRTH